MREEFFIGGVNQFVTFPPNNKPSVRLMFPNDTLKAGILVGQSNICDKKGQFLLGTDYCKVYGPNGDIVEGGEFINNDSISIYYGYVGSYSNASIILPLPNNLYYIFTTTQSDSMHNYYFNIIKGNGDYLHDEVRYSVVDMNANNGKGKVIVKNKILLHTNESPHVNKTIFTACRHANGRDWWLMKPSSYDRHIKYKFLIQPDTILTNIDNFSLGGNWLIYDNDGQGCFNQAGDLYAECNQNGPLEIYYFDRCSGALSLKRLPNTDYMIDKEGLIRGEGKHGLCFSPNGRFLYISTYYHIFQLDLENSEDATAFKLISGDTSGQYVNSNFPGYNNMMQTNAGTIYVGSWHGISNIVNAILEPDKLGADCKFTFNYFSTIYNTNDPPNMPFYGLGALKGSPCDSLSPPMASDLPLLIVPNAFSPNGDGLNDTWHILNAAKLQAEGIQFQEVGIFNRLGNCVFKSNDINFAWDAKGWASGTYFYSLQYKTKNGESKVQKGSVVVVR